MNDAEPGSSRQLGARQITLLCAAVGSYVAVGAIWLWRFRLGQPLDTDEAGFLAIAIADYHGFVQGGLDGWYQAVMAPLIQAPLMTTLVTPVYLVTGPDAFSPFVVPLALGAVMLMAAFGLGRAIAGVRVGWLTLALTAGTPVVIAYSRAFNFAIAAGCMSALLLWALARSDNFEDRRWSVAVGLFAGLGALSRTMMLAFLPALVVAGAIAIAAGPHRARRLLHALLAASAALVVAGPWYAKNGKGVYRYLTSYGYGSQSQAYGGDQHLLSPDAWAASARYAIETSSLPIVTFWVAGLVIVVASAVSRVCRDGAGTAFLRAGRSLIMPSLVWVTVAAIALTSTGNKGTGFMAPLVPPLALLVAWSISRASRIVLRRAAVAAVLVVVVINTVVFVDPRPLWSQPTTLVMPGLGETIVMSGQGTIQVYVAEERADRSGYLSRDTGTAWRATARRFGGRIDRLGAFTVIGFRHRLVNPNTIRLEQLIRDKPGLPMGWIDPIQVPNDLTAMRIWLTTGSASTACVLMVSSGTIHEIEPRVNGNLLAQAAAASGFERDGSIELPDGRSVVEWRRPATCPPG